MSIFCPNKYDGFDGAQICGTPPHTYIYVKTKSFLLVCFLFVGPKREKSKYFKMNRSTEKFIFFKELFCFYIRVCFQFVAPAKLILEVPVE